MSRIRLACLVSLAVLSIASIAGAQEGAQANASASPAAGGQCIRSAAREAVTSCPSGAAQAAKRPRPQGEAPASRLRAATREQPETKNQQPTGPSIEIDAATRRGRETVQARAFNLLQREVNILKRLVQNTRTDNPQRPDILLRLAETYFEMQQALNTRVRSFDDPIYQACQVQKNANACQQQRQQQRQAQQALNQSRQEAIRTYATLVQDHPNYRRMDEVLFSLAFGLEELRQQDQARQVYHRLIKGYPQSRFIPHAYLSFAEFYFQEGDMGASVQFYSKVTEFPPERNPVYGYALYKSAWAMYNQEDFRGALQKFVEVIEFATQNPDATDAANLARQARRELVLPYAMIGRPNQALDFFRRYAPTNEQAIEMLEKLGELYFDTGQWPNAIAVYHQLMAEQPDGDKLCFWQSKVTNAIISSRPKPEQVRELQRMVDVYEAFSGRANTSQERLTECKSETASILAWLATSWHREAIGTDTQPGTNDRNTMNLASQLYRLLVDKFPDMEQLEFPMIDRRDWPTLYRVAYYLAELLWKMEDWAQCGPAFDRVVEIDPGGEYTSDAAYAAVLCYNNLYQQQYQARERETRQAQSRDTSRRGRRGRAQQEPEEDPATRYAAREFTELEVGMLRAFQRYVCFIPDGEDLAQIKYRRARIYYESNHFEEAALLFKDIAFNHRDSELSEYAANLYLDCLNVMGSTLEPNRIECITEIKDNIQPMHDIFCNTDQARESHQELCGVLEQLRCDVLRKEAEAYQNNQQWKRAAATYVRIFRQYRECGRLDEVLYNAAINFEAARLLGRAIRVRSVLIQQFPQSEWSKRAVFLIGANYHALAFYEQAAEFYERFARAYPGEDGSSCSDADREAQNCPIAPEALQNAVFFRLGLNDTERAEADASLFERNYRRSKPRETSQVIFALGSIYERAEDWPRVIRHYERFRRDYARTALPQQLLQANVKIGMAYWSMDQQDRSERYFRDVVRAWERAPSQINEVDGVDEAQKILWLREAVDATAQALFHLAEFKYQEFRRIRFPRYSGGRSLERVNRWAQNDFMTWINEKRASLQAAEAEYNKVATLRVTIREGVDLESPPWQIAAAARIGQMYISIIDAVQEAPVPEEIEADYELYDIYVSSFDQPLEPVRASAMDKFEFCLRTATNVRWFNEYSAICESELNRLDPRRFPVAAELRGQPNFVHGTWGRPGAVELATEDDAELDESSAGDAAAPAQGGAQ